MPGFVDEVSREVVRGWYVADDRRRRSCRGVVISINGEDRYCALCQDARPDVVEAGITSDAGVGFLAPLALQLGDLVRVRALDNGRLLGDGLAVVMPEHAARGDFFDVETYTDLPAFRELTQPLRPHLTIAAFRPLFGQGGSLSTLCVETPAGRRVVHCRRPRRNALWLERLHRQVLEPNDIAAPCLEGVIAHGETASMVVEHIEGQILGPFTGGNEQAYRDAMVSAVRLQSIVWPSHMRKDRRGGRAIYKLITRVCLSVFKQQRWQELGLLLKMVRALYRLPRVFSHGDLHAHNVLIDSRKGKPVFIDWDHAGKLPIGVDLARLLLGVPPALAESWLDDDSLGIRTSRGAQGLQTSREHQASRERRLGWLIMTYFAQSQRQPDFHATEAGAYLRQRFIDLSGSRHGTAMISPIRSYLLPLVALYPYDNEFEPVLFLLGLSQPG